MPDVFADSSLVDAFRQDVVEEVLLGIEQEVPILDQAVQIRRMYWSKFASPRPRHGPCDAGCTRSPALQRETEGEKKEQHDIAAHSARRAIFLRGFPPGLSGPPSYPGFFSDSSYAGEGQEKKKERRPDKKV